MTKLPLFTSSAGVRHSMIQDGNQTRFAIEDDVAPLLEHNKQLQTMNDGYTADRSMRRAASIPFAIGLKWLYEEGWWFMDCGHDPDVAKKLAAKLNSNEYAYLRTADGHLGVSNGVLR